MKKKPTKFIKAKKTKYIVEVAITMVGKKPLKKELRKWVETTLWSQAFREGWDASVAKLVVRKVDID